MKAAIRSRKAISPLIATIILIAICVVGGLIVYSVFMSTSSTLSAKGQISVEAIDLVKATDRTVTFSITVKNTGNKPAKSLTVQLADESVQNLQVAGQNVSETTRFNQDSRQSSYTTHQAITLSATPTTLSSEPNSLTAACSSTLKA